MTFLLQKNIQTNKINLDIQPLVNAIFKLAIVLTSKTTHTLISMYENRSFISNRKRVNKKMNECDFENNIFFATLRILNQ